MKHNNISFTLNVATKYEIFEDEGCVFIEDTHRLLIMNETARFVYDFLLDLNTNNVHQTTISDIVNCMREHFIINPQDLSKVSKDVGEVIALLESENLIHIE